MLRNSSHSSSWQFENSLSSFLHLYFYYLSIKKKLSEKNWSFWELLHFVFKCKAVNNRAWKGPWKKDIQLTITEITEYSKKSLMKWEWKSLKIKCQWVSDLWKFLHRSLPNLRCVLQWWWWSHGNSQSRGSFSRVLSEKLCNFFVTKA